MRIPRYWARRRRLAEDVQRRADCIGVIRIGLINYAKEKQLELFWEVFSCS